MSDIAEKLLEAIGRAEKAGRFGPAPVAYVVEMGRGNYLKSEDVSIAYASEETERTAVLRHCAADREIVELYQSEIVPSSTDHSPAAVWQRGHTAALRAVIDRRARGYGVTP